MLTQYMTPTELQGAINNAAPGERIVYAIGQLRIAIEWGNEVNSKFAQGIQIAAFDAYRDGLVHLTQKKIGPDTYEYRATRSSRRRPPLSVAPWRDRKFRRRWDRQKKKLEMAA